jgi:O-antigen/teichoic acid export membrane protein
MTDHTGKLLRNTLLYLPAQFVPPAVQFAITVAWTYLLDPVAFGVVTFVIAAQEITAFIGVTAWSLYVLRFRTRFAENDEERFRLMDNRMVLCAAVVQVVLSLPILLTLGVSCEAPIFAATAAYLTTRTLLMHYGEWARAEHRIGVYTIAQLIGTAAGAGLSIAAILLLGPYPAVALAAQAVGQLAAIVVLFKQTGLRFRVGKFDAAIFAEVRRYGVPLIIGGVMGWAASNAIRVLVQYSDGPVALGLMSVGWGLGQRIAGVLAMLLTAAAYPLAVNNLERGDRHVALSQVSLNGVFLLAILAPALVGVSLLSRPLVTLIIAENFREMTIAILPIAMFAASLRFLRLHTSDQTMLLLERTDVSMKVTMVETALNILFCALGLHIAGIYGAALGMLAGSSLACIGGFAYSFALLGLPTPASGVLLRILLATAAMGLFVQNMPQPTTLTALTLTILAGVVVYASLIIIAFPAIRTLLGRQFRRLSGAPA